MNPLGIEMLTLLGMPPVEYVTLAAELGCAEVSSGQSGLPLTMFGITDFAPYPMWSLKDDPALRRETIAALRDTGVRIGLGEGFRIAPDCPADNWQADLDLMAELGAVRINAICMDEDMAASGAAADGMAQLAAMAAARGLGFTIEFFPPTGINTLDRALAIVEHVGRGKAQILLDTMHFFRTGGTVDRLAALDPELIGYVQLADLPAGIADADYFGMAMFARAVPGEGTLPLRELVRALPPGITVSLEVPRLDDLRAGMAPRDHAARCVAAARALWD